MYLAVIFLVLFFMFSFMAVIFKNECERIEHYYGADDANHRYYYNLFKKWETRCQRAWIICFVMIGVSIPIELWLTTGIEDL